MSNEDLVSVVIPLFNHERYIEACLDSVLVQDFPNLELLLLDDGSRDRGVEVARQWVAQHGGRFFRIWFETQPNVGITRTLDRLFKEAKGEYIVALASDDILLPDSISRRLPLFASHSVAAVFGDAIPIDDTGQVIGGSAIGELGEPADREALSDPRTLLWELIFRWNIYGSVLMCQRSALVSEGENSVLDTKLFSEDMQLFYLLAGKGVLHFLNEPVAKYRIHGTSTCRTPENLDKLRKNIYQSRRYAARFMPMVPRWIVRIQAFTYFRWRGGLLSKPAVLCSFAVLAGARVIYDSVRKSLLGQGPKADAATQNPDGRQS